MASALADSIAGSHPLVPLHSVIWLIRDTMVTDGVARFDISNSHQRGLSDVKGPTVYDAWHEPDGTAYILMEWIGNPGVRRLEDYWQSLTELQKENIASQLRGYLNQLRSLPQPSDKRGWIGPPEMEKL
jgi:hypothetical protein